jgi:phosphatidylglycerophosphate synthase
MRVLADIATALRLVLSAFIVYAGLAYGQDAFGLVVVVVLAGWTLDTLDGHLARAAGGSEPSWWGRNDRYIDVVLVLAGSLYLTLIGFVPA